MDHHNMQQELAVLKHRVTSLELAQEKIMQKLESMSRLIFIGLGVVGTLQVLLKFVPVKM